VFGTSGVMTSFLLLNLAAAVSISVIAAMGRLAPRLGLVDKPGPRKVHKASVPRVGGWGIVLGTLVSLLLAAGADPLLRSFMIGSFTLFAFGVWDDRREISHWAKFTGQILAAAIVVYFGDLYVSRLPFTDATLGAAVGKPLTIFAMVGVINAINHSDGLDGLAAGEATLSLIAFAILGYVADSALVVGIALATMGGIVGFLRYNSFPATVFMGDCGSQVLGFTLAFLAVYLTQSGNTAISAALPLPLIGFPIADILLVLFKRIRGGMHWFRATANHLHHRLLQRGLSHYQTVVIIYAIQAILVIAAVVLRYESDIAVTAFYLAVVGCVFSSVAIAERRGWMVRRGAVSESAPVQALSGLMSQKRLGQVPMLLVATITPAMILAGALLPAAITADFSLVAAGLAVLALVGVLVGRGALLLLTRLAVYGAAIFSAYLVVTQSGEMASPVRTLTLVIMIILAAAIALYIRFVAAKSFGTTPTDYLILLSVLALWLLGGNGASSRVIAMLVFFAATLMYGSEVIIEYRVHRRLLYGATIAALLIVAVRGVM
jgi:UDP-GlcNAc:undecaprenyl-phosphate GlcNAc-1-phosphate transferase